MRLHRPAHLAVGVSGGIDQPCRIEAHQTPHGHRRTEAAGGGRPEKPQRRPAGNTDPSGHIDPQRDRRQQLLAAGRTAASVQMRQHRTEQHRHRMHNGRFMHAIEFGIVNLVGVAERRAGRRQRRSSLRQHPGHAGSRIAAAVQAHEFRRVRPQAADQPDTDAVEQKGFCGSDRGRRQRRERSPGDVRGKSGNAIHRRILGSAVQPLIAESYRIPHSLRSTDIWVGTVKAVCDVPLPLHPAVCRAIRDFSAAG